MVENQPCNGGNTGLILGLGIKIPHASDQRSPWTTTRESACCNKRNFMPTETSYNQINKYFFKKNISSIRQNRKYFHLNYLYQNPYLPPHLNFYPAVMLNWRDSSGLCRAKSKTKYVSLYQIKFYYILNQAEVSIIL